MDTVGAPIVIIVVVAGRKLGDAQRIVGVGKTTADVRRHQRHHRLHPFLSLKQISVLVASLK